MATLKISDRQHMLRLVLTAAFEPRFNDIQAQFESYVKNHVAKEHPVFVRLYADPDSRAHLASGRVSNIRIPSAGGCAAYRPVWGIRAAMPSGQNYYRDRDTYRKMSIQETPSPASVHEIMVTNEGVEKSYVSAWEDYLKAHEALSALFNSYVTREKLSADFPEYAKYLPAIETKKKLPTVVVASVRAELAGLGVPAR